MKPRKKMCVGVILLFAVLFAQSAITAEAAWKPEKPISLIIPSTPGGGHDNNARLVAKYAENDERNDGRAGRSDGRAVFHLLGL